MSDILENLRCNAAVDDSPAARTWGVSLKVNNAQQASIDAVMDLVENKSYAVRLLLDLGWEAIEKTAFLLMSSTKSMKFCVF